MQTEQRHFEMGFVDFNLKKMDTVQLAHYQIPPALEGHVGNLRQYGINIARHFPENVAWFDPDQPWFFEHIVNNLEAKRKLMEKDVLIYSGSGMSAYNHQEEMNHAQQRGLSEEDFELYTFQEIMRNFLIHGKWVWGDCFGGQLGIHAVGGKLGRLPANPHGNAVTEAGLLGHELTEAGRADEVFGCLPSTFYAPHLHNDYVSRLPVKGQQIYTTDGRLTVAKSDILAVRNGYLDRDGLQNSMQQFIHAAVVEFTNGARLYHTQFHPEMILKPNFLVRMNPWVAQDEEMGPEYYERALDIPEQLDLSVSQIIPQFIEEARRHREETEAITFLRSAVAYTIADFEQYLIA